MKIRLGHVSNSSSSSFICNCCDEIIEDYDGEYYRECVNGHGVYHEHLVNGGDTLVFGYDMTTNIPAIYCPLCQFDKLYQIDLTWLLARILNTNSKDIFAVIKQYYTSYDGFSSALNGDFISDHDKAFKQSVIDVLLNKKTDITEVKQETVTFLNMRGI